MEVGTYQMKLNEIEVAVSGQVWDTDDDAKVVPTIQSYNSDELIKTDKQNLKLYTAEQMQEFMVENVRHTLTLYGAKVCGFHLERLEKEEIKKIIQDLFMEDTKND
ncbi:hypothetical protein OGZ44_08470 [Lactococcus lactis]|uniref:hypothetical protein n=1 Tax=Lactococcus lactis TaxID=1358 RepID=UPI002416A859|nr:hypothetical protein [Lactococcus lactis]MDG4974278.1 hypothetical protein [Lactococcus lactis]